MRTLGAILYAVRALRGSLSVNLPVSPQVRRDFKLDLIGAIMFGTFNGSVISFLYVVGRKIGVSPFGISAMVAMPAVGAILALPISLAIRGSGGRAFMFGTWILGRALILLLLVFSGPLPYTIIVSGFLISSSIATPFYASVMQHIYPMEFRGRLMSLVRVGSGTATTVTALVVAWLLGSTGVHFTVVFAAGTILALTSLALFAKVTPVQAKPRPRQSLRDTFAILKYDRPFAEYQLAAFIMGFGNIVGATLYPLVIVDKLHAGYGSFGILTVCSAVGYLVSFFVWGRVVDRKGPLYTILLVGVLAICPPLGMLLAPGVYWLIPVAFVSGVILAGFELGVYAAVIHYSIATPHEVPRYMALHSNFSGIRGLTAPFLATTILAGHHYGLALSTALVLVLGGTLMIWNRLRADQPVARRSVAQVS